MFKPYGIITPVLTALDDKENFNKAAHMEFVDRLVKKGVSGIFALGTNGEFYGLSFAEKVEVAAATVEAVAGRVPVYVGTGCATTKETIELSREVAKIGGVDCLSIVSPYYAAVSQDSIYRHYSAIAEAIDLPIILYNIPARTGNNIDYKTVKKLAKYENIVGVKDSSGNFDNTLKYIENTDSRLAVLAGSDSLILWTLLAGGAGAIAGCSNAFPEIMVSIYTLFKEGKIEEANKAQKSIRPFRNIMQLANPNSVVKRAVQLEGFNVGPAKYPLNVADPEIDAKILAAIKDLQKD